MQTLRDEIRFAEENGLEYVPPYKLAEISKYSNKIVKLLTDNCSVVMFSYADMKAVLRLADKALDESIREKSE